MLIQVDGFDVSTAKFGNFGDAHLFPFFLSFLFGRNDIRPTTFRPFFFLFVRWVLLAGLGCDI